MGVGLYFKYLTKPPVTNKSNGIATSCPLSSLSCCIPRCIRGKGLPSLLLQVSRAPWKSTGSGPQLSSSTEPISIYATGELGPVISQMVSLAKKQVHANINLTSLFLMISSCRLVWSGKIVDIRMWIVSLSICCSLVQEECFPTAFQQPPNLPACQLLSHTPFLQQLCSL